MADTQQRTDGHNEITHEQSAQESQITRNRQQGASRRFADPLFLSPRELFGTTPFALIRRMSEEMDRIFNDPGAGQNQIESLMWAPALEVAERDGNFVIHAELPGIRPEEVNVEVADDAILIQGERQSQTQGIKGGTRRTERRYGRFYRAIPLPAGANTSESKANFQNGVLEITIPLQEQQSKRRHIPVQPGPSSSAREDASSSSSSGSVDGDSADLGNSGRSGGS
jgi:HSP20 family protein